MQKFEQNNKLRIISILFIIFIYFLLVYKLFGLSYLHSLFKLFIHQQSKIKETYNRKLSIFTFWEPNTKIPGYIQLCINTWKKNMPNYHILKI